MILLQLVDAMKIEKVIVILDGLTNTNNMNMVPMKPTITQQDHNSLKQKKWKYSRFTNDVIFINSRI